MSSEKSKKKIAPHESSRVVSERGQTVIPKPIRDYMDLQSGDRLVWMVNESGAVIVHSIKKKSIMDLKGIVKTEYSMNDLNDEVLQAKEEHYRKRSESGGLQNA